VSRSVIHRFRTTDGRRYGLVFFGTPQRGPASSGEVGFGKMIVSIANSMGVKSKDIMEALTSGSLYSDLLQDQWRNQLDDYQIISFWGGRDKVYQLFNFYC